MKAFDSDLFIQTQNPPIDNYDELINFFESVLDLLEADALGIFVDEEFQNLIFFVLLNGTIQASFRVNLDSTNINKFLSYSMNQSLKITSRVLQGSNLRKEDLLTLENLDKQWKKAEFQEKMLNETELGIFLDRIYNYRIEKSRGKKLGAENTQQVLRESHGRCMFNGCGEKLTLDEVTGVEGNYGTLAHNIASSENGPRGVLYFSHALSNDPNNILLLCEKHHRLIDKVANAEYAAPVLSKMRTMHIAQCEDLLDALSFNPMNVYVILWPVNKNVPHSPSKIDVANSLKPLRARLHREIETFIETSDYIREESTEVFYQHLISELEHSVDRLIRATKHEKHTAAIFAFGPMPALIALGAKLGNKAKFTPMLMYRDGACWMWPNPECKETFYELSIPDLRGITEVSIRINFTADPNSSLAYAKALGFSIINLTAKKDFMGNGAIRNPQKGIEFSAELQRLFHTLKDRGIQKIHLFPCVSNAASIWIGQAYDVNHPEMVVYDFADDTMKPRIKIINEAQGTIVSLS